jgi:hypothetical protein
VNYSSYFLHYDLTHPHFFQELDVVSLAINDLEKTYLLSPKLQSVRRVLDGSRIYEEHSEQRTISVPVENGYRFFFIPAIPTACLVRCMPYNIVGQMPVWKSYS